MTDLFASGDNSSNSFDDSNDEIARKNETAFKYTTICEFNTRCERKTILKIYNLQFTQISQKNCTTNYVHWLSESSIFLKGKSRHLCGPDFMRFDSLEKGL